MSLDLKAEALFFELTAAFIKFKYKTLVGKTVGHNAFIANSKDLKDILDRYEIDPYFLFDIKVNDKDVTVDKIVRKLSS